MEIFNPGTVVVWTPDNFNPKFWSDLTEEQRLEYYGHLGYGASRPKLWVFLTEIKDAPRYCVLVSLDGNEIKTMCHTSEFRRVREDEF